MKPLRPRARSIGDAPVPKRRAHELHAQDEREARDADTGAGGQIGWRVTDANGHAVGAVVALYPPDGDARWALIEHRRGHLFLAPLAEAIIGGEAIFLPFSSDLILHAPEVEPDRDIDRWVIGVAAAHFDS